MDKFKILIKTFLVMGIFILLILCVVSVLLFFFTHCYIYYKIFYTARPAFEFQGRLVK
jgi:hypothetical protein